MLSTQFLTIVIIIAFYNWLGMCRGELFNTTVYYTNQTTGCGPCSPDRIFCSAYLDIPTTDGLTEVPRYFYNPLPDGYILKRIINVELTGSFLNSLFPDFSTISMFVDSIVIQNLEDLHDVYTDCHAST